MAAPQQSTIPTYKETSNIRANQVDRFQVDARDTAGYALAKLLGAVPGAVKAHQETSKEEGPGENETAQMMALAQMGAERDRLKVAKGGSFFGLLKSDETTLDAYQLERGRRQADLFAGELRDAYAASGLNANDDPKAFEAFITSQRGRVFGEILKDADPATYHGFVTRIGPVFEDMAKAHAGHLDGFIESQNKQAFSNRLSQKMDLDLTVRKEGTAFNILMDTLMGAESGGNYNAFHGNGNNRNIRFTDMTLAEVLDFQKSGQWRRHGAASSAVGKYQFIESTLRETIRDAGLPLDTKFSPAVQDQLIETRLRKHRKFDDFVAGNISAEEFLDKHLAKEFAGLKKTNGRGEYDGDGKNKASAPAARTIAALMAFRENAVRDRTGGKGASDDPEMVDSRPDVDSLAGFLETVEQDFGVPQTFARESVAALLIDKIEADPSFADRDDLWDIMAEAKLNKTDREKVLTARNTVRKEQEELAIRTENVASQAILTDADKYIREGDEEALKRLKSANREVYDKVLELGNTQADPENIDNDGFAADIDLSTPEAPQDALRAYVEGRIDRETYAGAMRQVDAFKAVNPVVNLPAIKPMVAAARKTLPGAAAKVFDAQLALMLTDLMEANGGKRPALTEIQAAVQQVQQIVAQSHQQDIQQRMGRPEYNMTGSKQNGE